MRPILDRWLSGCVLALALGVRPAAALAQAPDTVSLETRIWVAAKMLSAVETNFAHWEAVPDLDLDAAFRDYIATVATTDHRAEFSRASMRFLARLRNGHTGFFDSWLRQRRGGALGFSLAEMDAGWVVWQSQLPTLEVGERVLTIDDRPVGEVLAALLPYISASSEREATRKLWTQGAPLWPERFTLQLAGGRRVEVRRGEQPLRPREPLRFEGRQLDGGIAYLRIPSFSSPAIEDSALAFLRQHAAAPALVIDVRHNGGGTTPTRLIEALMDRPYRGFGQSSSLTIGLFSAYRQVKRIAPPGALDEYARGYIDAFGELDRPRFVVGGVVTPPGEPLYRGPLAVLIDAACASACEDFALPFKSSGRGVLIGEATSGSTGQPFLYDFGNGMSFRVSARRVYMPDGSPFEGVGIRPDVDVSLTIDDLRSGRDPVLERALTVLRH